MPTDTPDKPAPLTRQEQHHRALRDALWIAAWHATELRERVLAAEVTTVLLHVDAQLGTRR